jgi:hypothetical protein
MGQGLFTLGMVGAVSLVTSCGHSFAHMNGQPPYTHMNGRPHMEVVADCPGPDCALSVEDEEVICYGCTVPIP